nr:granzyme H-like isoform X1 [Lepeophtheirus salmonis]
MKCILFVAWCIICLGLCNKIKIFKKYWTDCNCGDGSPGGNKYNEKTKFMHKRIFNGYEPYKRPWMAFIKIIKESTPSFCGGAIINQKFILTAAHCFCDLGYCSRTKIGYKASKNIEKNVYYFTVPTIKHVHNKMKTGKTQAKNVIIYPLYNNITNDLAIIEMKKTIKISKEIMPLCLPFGYKFPDNEGIGVVAGWGFLQEKSFSK